MEKENGKVGRGHNVIHMKEIMLLIKNVATVYFNGSVEIVTRESIKKTRGMVMVKCAGLMAACTRVNGKRASRTV